MNGFDNRYYIFLMVMANLIAIFQLVASVKWTRLARLSFFLLFAGASLKNFITSQVIPQVYMSYAEITWSETYREFIHGWFSWHVKMFVGLIAFFQLLIAISFLLNNKAYKTGCIGGIIFLVAIIPLGIGSGFPATIVMTIALFILLNKGKYKLKKMPGKYELSHSQ